MANQFSPKCSTRAPAFLPKRRRRFSNSTTPPRATKVEAESAWHKPTRSCSGTIDRKSTRLHTSAHDATDTPPKRKKKMSDLYNTTKGDKGGSGIGLAQTYQIMQWHY